MSRGGSSPPKVIPQTPAWIEFTEFTNQSNIAEGIPDKELPIELILMGTHNNNISQKMLENFNYFLNRANIIGRNQSSLSSSNKGKVYYHLAGYYRDSLENAEKQTKRPQSADAKIQLNNLIEKIFDTTRIAALYGNLGSLKDLADIYENGLYTKSEIPVLGKKFRKLHDSIVNAQRAADHAAIGKIYYDFGINLAKIIDINPKINKKILAEFQKNAELFNNASKFYGYTPDTQAQGQTSEPTATSPVKTTLRPRLARNFSAQNIVTQSVLQTRTSRLAMRRSKSDPTDYKEELLLLKRKDLSPIQENVNKGDRKSPTSSSQNSAGSVRII